tara:strand:- start:6733 stop:7761 length:1029 start_codon:yes stop_codon:yes gene_type:complete
MKAAYLNKLNSSLKFSYSLKYKKLYQGQVLTKNYFTGICKSQIFEIYNGRENKKYIPHLLGHEATGIVVDKHKSVKKVKLGDRVILTWIKCKGKQSNNPIFFHGKKKINSGSVTTFSDHSIVSENRLLKLPKNISLRKGVILGCAFPTGSGMILNNVKKPLNKTIAFVGLGGVGVSALLTSLNFKFKSMYAFDISSKRINFLKKNIKSKKKIYFLKSNKKLYAKYINKFDYVIETSGSISGIESAFKILKNSGTMVLASHPQKGKKIKIDPFEFIKGKKIIGSWGGVKNYDNESKSIFKILNKIKNFEKIFNSDIYSFENINKAVKDLKNNKVLRPIIKLTN